MILYIIIWFLVIGLSCLCLFKVLPEIVVFWMFSVQLSFLELLGVIFFLLLVPRGKCKSDFKIYVPICHLWHSLSYIHIFVVAQFGLGGPNFARTSRDIARGSSRAFQFTRLLLYKSVSRMCTFCYLHYILLPMKGAVPLGPIFSYRDVEAIAFSCSNLQKYMTNLRLTTVCAKNPMTSIYSEKVSAKYVPIVFWYLLVDFSRDAWLCAFELCPWGYLTLDGHAWLNTPTQYDFSL